MLGKAFGTGLTPLFATPPASSSTAIDHFTEEAAITAAPGESLRVEVVAQEGAVLATGAAVARLRDHPRVVLVAPMAGRVAQVRLQAGRQLSEIVLFREPDGDYLRHDVSGAASGSAQDLADTMQTAGFWPRIRRRPFGRMPEPDERPEAIVVMAVDTRPLAPDPRAVLDGQEETFARGLDALELLTNGPIFVCLGPGDASPDIKSIDSRIQFVTVGPRHPQGLAGLCIHDLCPAAGDRPVWDLHAEDVVHLGSLIVTGVLPQTRCVSVAGPALTATRLIRCQPGADLRGLSYGFVRPGPHILLTGSLLDGHRSRWLGPRDRQVTVLAQTPAPDQPHWFQTALTRWSLPKPVIATAALQQSVGGAFPAMAMIRALSVGDDEQAVKLGALSLVEEDLALVDYIVGAQPPLRDLLRAMLDRAKQESAE